MGIKRSMNTPYGHIVLAAILGFGLSTLFRKSCSDKSCMEFKAPPLNKVVGRTYEFEDKCYQFSSVPAECRSSRRTVPFA